MAQQPSKVEQAPPGRQLAPVDALKRELASCEDQFSKALPAHISSKKFVRTVQTALTLNPDIVKCTRDSILTSCMRAAGDGLLLDGREAALVTFRKNVKEKRNDPDKWVDVAQYMPMVAGLIKRARNSGELSTLSAYVVYEKDEFNYELGDNERIYHKPTLDEIPGKPRLAYAIAKLKDGSIVREIMTVSQIRDVMLANRNAVDANTGQPKPGTPWAKWWSEMARKSVMRRLIKRLPISSDLASVFTADDEMYDPASDVDHDHAPTARTVRGRTKQRGAAAEKLKDAIADAQDADFEVVEPDAEDVESGGEEEDREMGANDLI